MICTLNPATNIVPLSGPHQFRLSVDCTPESSSQYCATITAVVFQDLSVCGGISQCVSGSGYYEIVLHHKETLSERESSIARVSPGSIAKDIRVVETDQDVHAFWTEIRAEPDETLLDRPEGNDFSVVLRSWREKDKVNARWSRPDTVIQGKHLVSSDLSVAKLGGEMHVIVPVTADEHVSVRYLVINGRQRAREHSLPISGLGYPQVAAMTDSIFLSFTGTIGAHARGRQYLDRKADDSNNVFVISKARASVDWSKPILVVDTGNRTAHNLTLSRAEDSLFVTFIDEESRSTRAVRRAYVYEPNRIETLFELEPRPSTGTHVSTFINRPNVLVAETGVNANIFYHHISGREPVHKVRGHAAKEPYIVLSPTSYFLGQTPCIAYTLAALQDSTVQTQSTCF
jgi:hypothetical protein